MFNRFDLEITIEKNYLVKTDFLDEELDLRNDTYAPLRKPSFKRHVNVESNLP